MSFWFRNVVQILWNFVSASHPDGLTVFVLYERFTDAQLSVLRSTSVDDLIQIFPRRLYRVVRVLCVIAWLQRLEKVHHSDYDRFWCLLCRSVGRTISVVTRCRWDIVGLLVSWGWRPIGSFNFVPNGRASFCLLRCTKMIYYRLELYALTALQFYSVSLSPTRHKTINTIG